MKAIRRNIRLIAFVLIAALFSLIIYGSYSIATLGTRWFTSGANNYANRVKTGVTAGSIFDRNQVPLAVTDANGGRIYHADARVRSAVVHAVGDKANNVAHGAETFLSEHLYAFNESYISRVTGALRGDKRRGNDVVLTIDSTLAAYIARQFPAGKSGAVVVINYKTGELLALQSFPGFDPMRVNDATKENPLQPFWNRATKWTSAPGSTYKIITLAAALERIPNATSAMYHCDGHLTVGNSTIVEAGGAVHGDLNLRRALAVSCNTVFAQLALTMGDAQMLKTAQAFRLNDHFLFREVVVEDSRYPSQNRTEREIAWTGVGQSALAVTPLHMALVASAIANNGVMMEPRLLLRAVSATGELKATFQPRAYATVASANTAGIIGDYMAEAVSNGTARGAAIRGLRVCGKTGSAQVDGQEAENAWFVGYIDNAQYPYAVCIAVENAGGGGMIAAPIARSIFQYLTARR